MAHATVFTDISKLDGHLEEEAVRKMGEQKLDYRAALAEVRLENPALMKLREALVRQQETSRPGQKFYNLAGEELVRIDNQIEQLTNEAVKAHPELDYSGALKLVASENRELFRLRESTWQVLHG